MAGYMDTPDSPLLTIAIPTYNRAPFLDLCLSRICPQLGDRNTSVELLVSNNCSTDQTDEVIRKYLSLGYPVTYLKNAENVGPDNNFVQCYRKAKGKYVLILGDDDILLDNALDTLVPILSSGDFGIVFLNSYGFTRDYISEKPRKTPTGYEVYADTFAFVRKVGHFFTFTSANIFNKTLVEEPSDWTPFFDSNLVQLAWTFSALAKGRNHVYVSEYLLAACIYNSGGYAVCQVFAHNFNKILDIFRKQGLDDRHFRAINRKLLVEHLPAMIALARNNIMPFKQENYFHSLYPLYRNNIYFWLCTVPVIVLPARMVYSFYRIAERLIRQRAAAPDLSQTK
ncbi:MAG: Abequosyltransferase RfbV [Syntrophorhabdus sp. PtaU1.Bin153]|nr:MAG: Abequosyltransferase RfbV [Syntrophorhabdus sp. PtaU1.Bin153]